MSTGAGKQSAPTYKTFGIKTENKKSSKESGLGEEVKESKS